MRKEEEKRVGASQRSSKGVLSSPRQTQGDNGAMEAESEAESSVSGRPARLAAQPYEGACRLGPPNVSTQPDFSASTGIWREASEQPTSGSF